MYDDDRKRRKDEGRERRMRKRLKNRNNGGIETDIQTDSDTSRVSQTWVGKRGCWVRRRRRRSDSTKGLDASKITEKN